MKTVSKTITIEYKYLSPSDAGKMLKKLHTRNGMSYKHIAEQIGVSAATVSRWVSGENEKELHPNSQIRIWEIWEKTTGMSGKINEGRKKMKIEEIKKMVLGKALNREVNAEDIAHYEDCDYLSVNTGRDGKQYVWYFDGTTEEVADMEGNSISSEKIAELFE